MPYYQGFLAAVPEANKDRYREEATKAWEMFKGYGALQMVETWGVDVPDGKVTSFPMATKKKDDETVIFSWIVWPDRATADAATHKMMADHSAAAEMEMPFDGMRMMWGGFEELVNVRA